jgi:hypothetical protein
VPWIVATVVAAAARTARNAMQSRLTAAPAPTAEFLLYTGGGALAQIAGTASARAAAGMALVVAGVALLLLAG